MKKLKIILLIIAGLLFLKFWVGIYADDEFYENRIFIKHRPIWKTYFYSPRGMRDYNLEDMNKEDQIEQKLFDEFISTRKIQ